MLELSPAGTQVLTVLPICCFASVFDLMTTEPSSMKSNVSRPQDERPSSELHVTLIKVVSEQEKT